jgi:BirA family biotin operon repressor/biotin-[acetyl-CoA-carboxylase] ligase
VIGIGVNLAAPAGGWDVDGAARPCALAEFAHGIPDARTLAPQVARALELELAALARDEADVVARARAAMPLWGRRVRGEQGSRLLEGTAKDLAPDGGLVIRLDSGAEVIVHAGDVRVAWEAS